MPFRELARRNIVDLAAVESEIFAFTFSNEKLVPLKPRYWDLQADGTTSGMSRALLKFNGGSVHDYATIADDSPKPSRASRARRAATSASIS